MPSRGRFVLVGAVLLLIIAGIAGFRRVPETRFAAGPWVASTAFGSGLGQAGRVVGIDGRPYGPLTFASNGKTTVVADTYHEQLLYFHHRQVKLRPLKDAMVEDMSVNAAGRVLVADNRALTLWLVSRKSVRKVVSIPHTKGYTEALWRVGLTPNDRVLVEWVRFGRGTFSTHLDEYSADGRFIRSLAESRVSRNGFQPLGRSTDMPIRDFQVAPDGNVYVEPENTTASDRVIRIYRPNGLPMGHVVIHSRGNVRRTDFLGIDRRGWIYLAINIDVPHKARVLVVNGHGQQVADIPIAAVPVYAATFGRVLPSGQLLLDQSTISHYRIREYRPVTRRVLKWVGF